MSFDLSNNVNIPKVYTPSIIKPVEAPPEKELPVEKKKASSPAIDNLSSLLASTKNEPTKKETEVFDKLSGIDSQLTDIENFINEINSQGELTVEATGKILAKLKELQAQLDDIEKEIQSLSDLFKLSDEESAKAVGQVSQVDLLRKQIDAQRELQKQGASDATAPAAAPVVNQQPAQAV